MVFNLRHMCMHIETNAECHINKTNEILCFLLQAILILPFIPASPLILIFNKLYFYWKSLPPDICCNTVVTKTAGSCSRIYSRERAKLTCNIMHRWSRSYFCSWCTLLYLTPNRKHVKFLHVNRFNDVCCSAKKCGKVVPGSHIVSPSQHVS